MSKNQIQSLRSKNATKRRRRTRNNIWILPLILFAIASVYAVLYFDPTPTIKPLIATDGLWQGATHNDRPKLVLLGNIVLQNEIQHKNNTAESNPSSAKIPLSQSLFNGENTQEYLTAESTVWIQKLTEILISTQSDFNFNTVSKFNTEQLNTHDIIAVGIQKNLGLFQSYWTPSKIKYDQNKNAFFIEDYKTKTHFFAKGNPGTFQTDYSYISKLPGVNDNTIYIFSGISNTGTTHSLTTFTDARIAKKLEQGLKKKFDSIPAYYEVLLEVNAINTEESNSEIVAMFAIKN